MEPAKVSGFRKSERILQSYADSSAYYLRNPITIFGVPLQLADFTCSCGFLENLSLLNLCIILFLRIPQTVPGPANVVADSTNFIEDSAKLTLFGAILKNTVL